jgi:hypothetical protein
MAAPKLAVHQARPSELRDALAQVPDLKSDEVIAVLQVVRAGSFWGRDFGLGELVVCTPGCTSERMVVLIAQGYGRPRFGAVSEGELMGDSGEPCSRARWRAVGPVAAVLSPLRRLRPQERKSELVWQCWQPRAGRMPVPQVAHEAVAHLASARAEVAAPKPRQLALFAA